MNQRHQHLQVLIFALVGMFLIRLLAWGGGQVAVHAESLNQTIPTPTPSGAPVIPPTPRPTHVSPTHEPIVPTIAPTSPSIPAGTLPPSSVPSVQPVVSTPTATSPISMTDTATPEENRTMVTPGSPSPTSEPPTASATVSSGEALPVASGTVAPTWTMTVTPSSTVSTATAPTGLATPAVDTVADRLSGVLRSPYLWLIGGALLIGTGAVFLVRQRRSS
jgi:hypothetical protein